MELGFPNTASKCVGDADDSLGLLPQVVYMLDFEELLIIIQIHSTFAAIITNHRLHRYHTLLAHTTFSFSYQFSKSSILKRHPLLAVSNFPHTPNFPTVHQITTMASVVIAIGAIAYFTTEKVHERKQKKRALKAQEALDRGVVEELSAVDGTTDHSNNEDLPAYHKESLPAFRNEKHHHRFHL
jgi:hypothetical protein